MRNRLLQMRMFLLTPWLLNMFCLSVCLHLDPADGYGTPTVNKETLSCTNISTGKVFTYSVLSDVQTVLDKDKEKDKDCDQGWYDEEGNLLSVGQHNTNKSRHPLVVNEHTNNLTLSKCIRIYHRVDCNAIEKKFNTTYYVINDTNSQSMQQKSSETADRTNHTIPIIVVVGVVLMVGILIWCYKKNRRQPINTEETSTGETLTQNGQHDQAVTIPMLTIDGEGGISEHLQRGPWQSCEQ